MKRGMAQAALMMTLAAALPPGEVVPQVGPTGKARSRQRGKKNRKREQERRKRQLERGVIRP